jgi:hypothetical protein
LLRISSSDQDAPYLAARADNTGSFVSWLQELNIQHPKDVTVAQMVSWSWIRPSFRIMLPDRYFLDWKDFPSYAGTPHEVRDRDIWADHLWYSGRSGSGWLIRAEPLTGPWFIHPFDRPGGRFASPIAKARKQGWPRKTTGKAHPNKTTYFPWIDYFPHWKGYELIECLTPAKFVGAVWLTSSTKANLKTLVARFNSIRADRRRWLSSVQRRWQAKGTVFNWIASYRALIGSLEFARQPPRQLGLVEDWSTQAAARELAAKLRVTAADLEVQTEEHLLGLASDWKHWLDRDGVGPGKSALGNLQKDTVLAIDWLYHLTGNTVEHYYDKWSHQGREPRAWASLEEALPLDFRISEQFFFSHFLSVRHVYDLIPAPARLSDDEIVRLLKTLREKTWLTIDWLGRYQSLHEALGGPPSWDWAGISPNNLLHDFTLLAIYAEKILEQHSTGTGLDVKPLVGQLARRLEESDKQFVGAWGIAEKHWSAFTNLKAKPLDPFGDLLKLQLTGTGTAVGLARSLLFFGLSRNYFAHHSYQHSRLI